MFSHIKKVGRYPIMIVGGVLVAAIAVALCGYTALSARAATPSPQFSQYSLSTGGGYAIGITVDKNGNPWFGLGNASVGTIDPQTGALKAYALANTNAGIGTIKVGGSGEIWFTEGNAPGIGKIDPVSGKESEYLLPPASRQLTPTFLVLDGSGNVWFNEADFSDATGGKLARLSPDGTITEWSVPTVGAELEEIALDSKGNLWFAEQGNSTFTPSANKVGKLDPVQNTITEYAAPTPNSRPAGITIASDDTVWFSEHATDKIAHLFPNVASGVTTSVTPASSGSSPATTTQSAAPDVPTNPATTAAQATSATSQVTHAKGIVEYSLPHSGSVSNTEDMRFDKNGNLYFENDTTHQIGALIFNNQNNNNQGNNSQGNNNNQDNSQPTIKIWAIPGGVGFFNIEFDNTGKNLWISDTANFKAGGSVYKFTVN